MGVSWLKKHYVLPFEQGSMVHEGHPQISIIPVSYKKFTFMLCFTTKKCQKSICPYWLSLKKMSLIKVSLIKQTACIVM